MDRRDFAKLAGVAAVAPQTILRAHTARATEVVRERTVWPGYERTIAIDCLASPGPFNTPGATDNPLTPEMVANAKSSGITAVNLTVSANTFADTFRQMAYWENELQAHPDVLMKIYSLADVRRAKETGRLGLIYGFQNATMLEGDATNLDHFQRFGVRIIQLTYNDRNILGDGCLEPANAGLSRYGYHRRRAHGSTHERPLLDANERKTCPILSDGRGGQNQDADEPWREARPYTT